MFCQKCGKELIEGAVFCYSCGNPVQIQGKATTDESTVLQKNITNVNTAVKRSKPLYKRWWVWIIAAVVLFFILAAIGSCDSAFNVKTVDSGSSSQPQASTSPKNLYPDEILYDGVPISQIFQTQAQDIRNLLGEPTHVEDGENASYCYGTIEGTEGSEIWLNYNQQGHLNEINAYGLSKFTFNGTSLDGKTHAELAEILGEPNAESDPTSSRAEYYMNWQYSDYTVDMLMQSANLEEIPFTTTFINKDWIPDQTVNTNMIDENFEWVEYPNAQSSEYSIVGIIKNTTNKTFSYVSVSFSLYDADGNQIGSASDSISDFVGGNTWKFKAFIGDDSAARFSFKDITAW